MDELTLDDKKYLSSKRAAQVTGYAKDYVGQLAREGRVEARLVGRNWYILESSILEHRFGAEEKTEPEVTAEELSATWETPKYIPEASKSIPELVPKPQIHIEKPTETNFEPSEGRQVLEDMQTAWKEWFATREQEEEPAPQQEKEEELMLDDHEVGHFEIKPLAAAPVAHIEPEEDAQIVRIERHSEPEPAYVPQVLDIAPRRQGSEPTITYAPAVNAKKFRKQRRVSRKSTNVMRAIFVAIAVIAVTVTLIGSGSFDGLSGSSFITNFFSGTTEISK